MMDGDFVDADQDGLPDLVTVGQHASIRFHKMVLDPQTPAGFRFETSKITQAGRNVNQEYLRVLNLNDQEKKLKSRCVYITGEHEETCNGNSMQDRIWCLEDDGWQDYDLPHNTNSAMSLGRARLADDGTLVIKARHWRWRDQSQRVDRYFRVPRR